MLNGAGAGMDTDLVAGVGLLVVVTVRGSVRTVMLSTLIISANFV